MIGVDQPFFANSSTMYGTAFAASSLFTVTRTISEPARASAATCCTVLSTSAVSVFVIDCTTTGASEPTRTPPILTVTARRRCISGINSPLPSLSPHPGHTEQKTAREQKEGMVARAGVQPATFALGVRCSMQLSYRATG